MKDAKGHGSDARGDSGVSDSDIAQYNAIIRKNSERNAAGSYLARANAPDGRGPGEVRTAAIAAQHGFGGPAVSPRAAAEGMRSVVGKGRGESYATSNGMRAAREIRTRLQLGGKL